MEHKFSLLKTLLESPPDFGNREMITMAPITFSYSEETVKREFDIVSNFYISNQQYWVIIKKNRSFAAVGYFGNPPENKAEVRLIVVAQADFKDTLELSFFNELDVDAKNVRQIDGVEVYDNKKMSGIGSRFYFALAQYGFVVISDNFQYLGGKALWKKIAASANREKCAVFVIDEGVPFSDESGDLIRYDGANISDDQLWSTQDAQVADRKKNVLFVLKKI